MRVGAAKISKHLICKKTSYLSPKHSICASDQTITALPSHEATHLERVTAMQLFFEGRGFAQVSGSCGGRFPELTANSENNRLRVFQTL